MTAQDLVVYSTFFKLCLGTIQLATIAELYLKLKALYAQENYQDLQMKLKRVWILVSGWLGFALLVAISG